jgi:hypothetical protein
MWTIIVAIILGALFTFLLSLPQILSLRKLQKQSETVIKHNMELIGILLEYLDDKDEDEKKEEDRKKKVPK